MRQSAIKSKSVPPQKWKTPLIIALLAGLLVLVYWPAICGGFIWDDDVYVTNNPLLTAPHGWQDIWFSAKHQSQFFPLVFTTLRVEHALWGLNPFGYHLANILLHAANAVLVWLVLRRMGIPGAWMAAALFAFHPVQAESVAWITELKNTQSTLFYLLALLTWINFIDDKRSTRWKDYSLTVLFYVLALLSKTTACTLPAALLLIPWIQGKQIGWRRIGQIIPFLILGIAAGLLSIWWEQHLGNYRQDVGQNLTLVERVLIAAHALWFYVGKLIWPVNLTFSYPHWQVNAGEALNYIWLAGCLAVMFALWFWRKTLGRRVIGAVIFFAAALSPLLGFIPLYTFKFSYVADHYQYVACIGLLALAAAGLQQMPRVFSVIVLLVLGGLTWKQAHIYQDQKALWEDTLAKNPTSWMADDNLGTVYRGEGDFEKAIDCYRKAIQLNPNFAQAHYNLGIILFKTGDAGEAMSEFQEAIQLDPQDALAFYNFANALDQGGQPDDAIKQYEEAVRLKPDFINARVNLGIAFGRLGRLDEAATQFQEVVRLDPDNAEAHNNLGAVLRAQGRLDEAIEQFQDAIRINPEFDLARTNLNAALSNKTNPEKPPPVPAH
jgi:tetratricopeptide (TPR) repeat protein